MPTVHQKLTPFGVEIRGIDFAASPSTQDIKTFLSLFHEHRVVVVKGQKLTPEQFEAYGHHFGQPKPHFIETNALPGHPKIGVLTNDPQMRDEVTRNTSAYWHTDNSYQSEPSTATTLYAVAVPREGGQTHICDMVRAYEDLPAHTRRSIDGLRVQHLLGNRDAAKEGRGYQNPHLERKIDPVWHPLVVRHPVTGRKALYSPAGSARRIEGMSDEKGVALLDELTAHALQEKYVLHLKYDVGDLAAWDNFATMHSASILPAGDQPQTRRVMYRISVAGFSPLLV